MDLKRQKAKSIQLGFHPTFKKKKKIPDDDEKKREIFKLSSSKSRKVFVVFVTHRDIIIKTTQKKKTKTKTKA